jgi:hypothetical protein
MQDDGFNILTRVGPGTPMGNLFRRFWLPAAAVERNARTGWDTRPPADPERGSSGVSR